MHEAQKGACLHNKKVPDVLYTTDRLLACASRQDAALTCSWMTFWWVTSDRVGCVRCSSFGSKLEVLTDDQKLELLEE